MTPIHALISVPFLLSGVLAPQDCDDDGGGGGNATPVTDITFRWDIGAPIGRGGRRRPPT
jgi:hypothetical protein